MSTMLGFSGFNVRQRKLPKEVEDSSSEETTSKTSPNEDEPVSDNEAEKQIGERSNVNSRKKKETVHNYKARRLFFFLVLLRSFVVILRVNVL